MNIFYNQTLILIWLESTLLLILGFYPALIIIEAGYISSFAYLGFLFCIPIAHFSFTPLFKLIGIYKYYSPMLIGYMPNKIKVDLHSGTSFDYLLVMRNHRPGNEMRNQLLIYYLEGLIYLIREIESGEIPKTINIMGSSYFFNTRTLKKLGFDEEKPTLFYRLNLLLNFIDIFWMYSLSKNKITFPKLWKVKKLSISGENLLKQKIQIEKWHQTLIIKIK